MNEYKQKDNIIGKVLQNRYRVECLLGQGGTANTYRAVQLSTNSFVAIKRFMQYRERFEQEVLILRKYHYLDGIVPIIDYFIENGSAYIVMDYIEGITLQQYVTKYGRMAPADVWLLFLPVMKSLGLLHKQGIVHRDISPDNLMIDIHNQLWLIDFGAAGLSSRERTLQMNSNENEINQTVIFKAGYTPYEQYRTDAKLGSWTDVYAICASIYTACSGIVPPDVLARLNGEELTKVDAMPVWQWEALQKGMAISYENRYQNMGELIDGLTVEPTEGSDNLNVTIYPEHVTDYTSQMQSMHSLQQRSQTDCHKERCRKWVPALLLGIAFVLIGSISIIIEQQKNKGTSKAVTEESTIEKRTTTEKASDENITHMEAETSSDSGTSALGKDSVSEERATEIQKKPSTTTEAFYQIEEKSDYDEFELGE